MANRIIYEGLDGTILHMVPAINSKREDESLDDFVERVATTKAPPGSTRLPGNTKLPGHHFRNCWRRFGDTVQVDMPLARVQRMAEIRAERDAKLLAADGPTAREVEQNGLNKAAWIDYKQALRDLPAGIDLDPITNADALEGYQPLWPIEPGG